MSKKKGEKLHKLKLNKIILKKIRFSLVIYFFSVFLITHLNSFMLI